MYCDHTIIVFRIVRTLYDIDNGDDIMIVESCITIGTSSEHRGTVAILVVCDSIDVC